MQVTYHYSPDLSEEHSSRSKREDTKKSFTFWTVVRLGKVSIDVGRTPTSGLPAMSTEARRSALDKRRSIMGINVNQSIGPSTLASLRESNRAKLPTDRAGNTEDDEDWKCHWDIDTIRNSCSLLFFGDLRAAPFFFLLFALPLSRGSFCSRSLVSWLFHNINNSLHSSLSYLSV